MWPITICYAILSILTSNYELKLSNINPIDQGDFDRENLISQGTNFNFLIRSSQSIMCACLRARLSQCELIDFNLLTYSKRSIIEHALLLVSQKLILERYKSFGIHSCSNLAMFKNDQRTNRIVQIVYLFFVVLINIISSS
jgi:hypothetical protein